MERKCLQIMNQKGMGLIIHMILIFKVTYIISNKLENWIGLDSKTMTIYYYFTKLILQ